MDLLNFRMRLAEELIYVGKTVTPPSKKKGRPTNTPSPVVKKKLYSETQKMMLVDSRPPTSVQHDSVNHLPNYDGRKESTRCKNTGCKGRTHSVPNKSAPGGAQKPVISRACQRALTVVRSSATRVNRLYGVYCHTILPVFSGNTQFHQVNAS
ncbi:hypothetical protein QTP88_019684 [Uroleucon formosanum]